MVRFDEISPLFSRQNWPFYWLSQVVGRYQEQIEPQLKQINLDISRWRVLGTLGEDTRHSMSELAEQAIVKLPTMMKIVQRMQADGLVLLSPKETDGRVTEVALTPKGVEAREAALALVMKLNDSTFSQFSKEEINQLNSTLARIFTALKR
jgi:DNA-binding MarR family transcriptional regulator